MVNDKTYELSIRIDNVISLLETEMSRNPRPMFDLILKRYKNAKSILSNQEGGNSDLANIKISGGVRAFLDASSDYMHPVLDEMDNAEKLLEALVK